MLVADLIELARGDEPRQDREDVRLDELVRDALVRARRHAPAVEFVERLGARGAGRNARAAGAGGQQPVGQRGEAFLGRAAWSRCRSVPRACGCATTGRGSSRADLPFLFDRFYRGATARGRPGSGLGLAIVRQVAEQHGGSVSAANAPGGGAEFVLALPAAAPPTSEALWHGT